MEKKVDADGRGRPTSTCVKCGQRVILGWGLDNNPIWRHSNGKCTLNNNQRDLMTHNLARDLLVSFLNKGYTLEIIQKCPNSANRVYKLSDQQEAIAEYTYNRARFDIGCFGAKDAANDFAIEICHTHVTTNLVPREPVDWVELNACEVLDVLDQLAVKRRIRARNIRRQCTQPSCVACKPFEALLLDLGILRIEYSTFRKKTNEERRWKLNFEALSEEQAEEQTLIPKVNLWTELIQRGICAHCKRKRKIAIHKPYCGMCVRKLTEASEDGGESGVFGDLFAPGESTGNYSITEYLNKIFNGTIILSEDDVLVRNVKKQRNAFIATSKIHQLYLQWSARENTDVSAKKVSTVLAKEFSDKTSYVGHTKIKGKDYWGFHISEPAWGKVKISSKIYFDRADEDRVFKLNVMTLDEFITN